MPQFRREWRASLLLGGVSFAAPFLVTMAFAYWALDWSSDAAQIAGIALSTTSLAVVYAVLVETGLNQTLIGKRIMSATFVTDFGTAAALSILFIKPNFWIVVFAAVSAVLKLRTAAAFALVLRPLRQLRDRARDQARLCQPLPTHVARRQGALARGPTCLHPRPRSRKPLRHASQGAGTPARGRLRLPDAPLLLQGRHERLRLRAVGETRRARAPLRSEAGAQAPRRLPARPPLLRPARRLHHPADVDGAHLRHDLLALRPAGGHHRRGPVLAPRRHRRPLGDRPRP